MAQSAAVRPFRRDVHGLRAVAVSLVVLDHAHLAASGGYIGVDVFFIISGFLITGHVLGELQHRGTVDLVGFWARRMRRILPAALLVALVTLVAGAIVLPPLLGPELAQTAAAVAAYVPNVLFAAQGTDYLAGNAPSPFQHYWSLGVEEQFYLVWPVVLLAVWWLARKRAVVVGLGIAAVVLASLALCLVVAGISQPWAFFSLPTRAWELALGGFVAWLVLRGVRLPAVLAGVLGWLGLAAIVVAAFAYDAATPYPGIATLVPVLGAALIVLAGQDGPHWGPVTLLALRPFAAIGTLSYSLYLWHWPLLVLPQAASGRDTALPWWGTALALGGSVLLAWLTYRFVEEPTRASRPWALRGRWRPLLTGVVASVALVATALGSVPVLEARPTTSDRPAAASGPVAPARFTPYVPSNVTPSLWDVGSDSTTIHRNGCHIVARDDVRVPDCVLGDPDGTLTVALVGDSHAMHWWPALERWAAERGGVRLVPLTKAGCPVVDVDVELAGTLQASCAPWRAAVVERLRHVEPDVVLVADSNQHAFVGPEPVLPRWTAATTAFLGSLPASARVTVLANTPQFDVAPVDCLSANVDDADACGIDRSAAVDQRWIDAERRAVERAGHAFLDLNDYFCDARRCAAVPWRATPCSIATAVT